jgi:hypothetical protein
VAYIEGQLIIRVHKDPKPPVATTMQDDELLAKHPPDDQRRLRIFRENTKREAIADSYNLNRVTEVACEFKTA